MGIRYIPEHKPSLKKGPRVTASGGETHTVTETVTAPTEEKIETPVVVAPPIVEKVEEKIETPAVEEKSATVEEKPVVAETAKDVRKKKP